MPFTSKVDHIAASDLVTKPVWLATSNVQHPVQGYKGFAAAARTMHHHQGLVLYPMLHKP